MVFVFEFEDAEESDLTVFDLRTGGEGLLAVAPGRGFSSVFSIVFLYFGGWPSNKTNEYITKKSDVTFSFYNISNHYFDRLNK